METSKRPHNDDAQVCELNYDQMTYYREIKLQKV